MKNRHKNGMKRLTALVCLLVICVLAGCGGGGGSSSKAKTPKVKDFVGYYTLDWDLKSDVALQVNSDGSVTYMETYSGSHRGTLEIEDDEAHIYLTKQYETYDGSEKASSLSKFCPLTLTLTDNGKSALLSSEHPNWSAGSFDVVDKKTFESFIDGTGTPFVVYDGKDWQTPEDRKK